MKKLMILMAFIAIIGCATTAQEYVISPEEADELERRKASPVQEIVISPEETEYLEMAKASPTAFIIDIIDEKDAWGRAQSFIGRFSSMKVQSATKNIIQTYTPTGTRPSYGYNITKTPVEDGVAISVNCLSNNMFENKEANQNAHVLAYYIKTGKLYPKYIYK